MKKEDNLPTNDLIIQNIKYYREKLKISREDLSIMIGKKSDYIEKYEERKYKRTIDLDSLDKIAKVFKIKTYMLLEKRKEMIK